MSSQPKDFEPTKGDWWLLATLEEQLFNPKIPDHENISQDPLLGINERSLPTCDKAGIGRDQKL